VILYSFTYFKSTCKLAESCYIVILNIISALFEVENLTGSDFLVVVKATEICLEFYTYVFQVKCFASHTLIPNSC
jgi:hypothetical protein